MITPTIEDSLDYDTISDTVENEITAAYYTSPISIGQLFESTPYSWIIVDDFACFQYATDYSVSRVLCFHYFLTMLSDYPEILTGFGREYYCQRDPNSCLISSNET